LVAIATHPTTSSHWPHDARIVFSGKGYQWISHYQSFWFHAETMFSYLQSCPLARRVGWYEPKRPARPPFGVQVLWKRRVTRIINDVSASQPQQATSDYLSPALYACAFAAVVPAGRRSLPRTPVVGKSVGFPVASSQERHRCPLSHGFHFVCGAVAAWTDGASKLFQLDTLSWEWFQSEYL